jgi:hypothetical protein
MTHTRAGVGAPERAKKAEVLATPPPEVHRHPVKNTNEQENPTTDGPDPK